MSYNEYTSHCLRQRAIDRKSGGDGCVEMFEIQKRDGEGITGRKLKACF